MANEFVTRKGLISLGGISYPYTQQNSTYSVSAEDYYIDCNGSFTVTLPTSVGIKGRIYVIKNSGSGIITVSTVLSETIDGQITVTLSQDQSIQIQSNGTGWTSIFNGTISNASDNRILTSDGTSHSANAEANLTFDSGTLSVVGNLVVSNYIKNGFNTEASTYSVAFGFQSEADGYSSVATGDQTFAGSSYSFVAGIGTITYKEGQFAVGRYNTDLNSEDLFVIGDGENSGNRSDLAKFATSSIVFNSSLQVESLDFASVSVSTQERRMYWDQKNRTVAIGLAGGNVNLQLGQEEFYLVTNQTGATLSNGKVVGAVGVSASGDTINAGYFLADGSISSEFVLGIVTEDIPQGEKGFVTEFGLVRGINTTGAEYSETWSEGDLLWASPTISGGLTKNKPSAPSIAILTAIVISATSSGSLFVRPTFFGRLQDLDDVEFYGVTPSHESTLQFSSTASLWTWREKNYGAYSAGVITGATAWSQSNNGTITLPTVTVALYDNADFEPPLRVYTLSGTISGTGITPALTNDDTNYIFIDYNNGSPIWNIDTNGSSINNSNIIRYMNVYRLGNFIHNLEFGNQGLGLTEKLNARIIATDRFARESGLTIGLSGSTGILTLSDGVAWNGSYRQELEALNSVEDFFFKNYHSGGNWTYSVSTPFTFSTASDLINNEYYDDGNDRITASASKYLVNWYYRGQEINDHLYEVLGNNQYDTFGDAEVSGEPGIPELVQSHAILVGRVIVQVGTYSGVAQTAFGSVFQSSSVTSHNDLSGIQGGAANDYYHLTLSELNSLAFNNVNNNFTNDQTINGYTLQTGTWTESNILISTTNSVIGSGFTFNDSITSSNTIWSSQKVYDYSNRSTIEGNKTFSGDILIQGTLSVLDSFTAGTEFTVNTNSIFNGDILPSIDSTYSLGSSTYQWESLYVASQSVYVGGVTISSNLDAISVNKLNLGTEAFPTILTGIGDDIYINGNIFSAGDAKTLIVAKDGADFTSIKTALDSINDATASNVYTVKVRSGIYYEEPFTVPSYVALVGESYNSTVINATFSNQTLITMSDLSLVSDFTITGCTGSGIAAVQYSSPQQLTTGNCYMDNIKFGTNYTHVKIIGTASGSCQIQLDRIKYGPEEFTIGFHATNAGSGLSRLQIRNSTSTRGGIASTTGQIFALADATNCGLVINETIINKQPAAAQGVAVQVQNGGFLIATNVAFQRWSKAIYFPEDAFTPSIDAIGLGFLNNTIDVEVENTKTLGKIEGPDTYLKTIVSPTASVYLVGKDPKRIVVAKKGGDFASIKSAVESIIDSSDINRYVVEIGPGNFYEHEIDLSTKPYVSIVGSNIQTTQVFASASNHNLFKMGIFNEISFLSLNDVGNGYSAILAEDSGDFSQVHKVSFYNCDTGIKVLTNSQETLFYGEYVDFNGTYTQAIYMESNNGVLGFANIENFYCFPGSTGSFGSAVYGTSSTLNVAVSTLQGLGNDVAFYIEDGGKLSVTSTDITGFETGLWVPNIGTASEFNFTAVTLDETVTTPINIQQPNTRGFFQGSIFDHTTITTNSSDIYWSFLDRIDGELNVTRKFSITFADQTTTDASTLLFETAPMGVLEGGIISTFSGSTVSISAGYGYVEVTAGTIHKRIDWSTSLYGFGANVAEYLYINENGIIVSSSGLPSIENNILLGRVVTLNGEVLFIDNSRVQTKHADNKLNLFNRKALGSIYESGSLVTSSTYSISVSGGSYWYGDNNFTPTGGNGITFSQFIRDGIGGWIVSSTNSVTSEYENNTGSLITMSASYFTKHTLYVIGEGVDEKYLMVVGQTQYQNLVDAEGAGLPTPPTYFEDGVTSIASIYVQQGASSIYQIEDIRPVIGFKSSGVNATSDHGNLLGLSDDDHQQYLLVSGSRAMTGNLQMGSNSITGVNLVNGVQVESHASRHLPNGADPLSTAIPVTIGTVSSEGNANSFARSNHVHAHGDQPGGTLHAVATTTEAGFMSATDKTTFDAIPATYVNVSGDNITGFLGVTGSLSFTFSSMTLTSNTSVGAVYSTDYSSTFTNNSLVSKKYVDDRISTVSGGIVSTATSSTTITTTASQVTIATFSVPQGFTSVVDVYVTATSSSSVWGAWKREVVLTNFSGTANAEFVNSQLDRQSGLIPTNLSFTCSSSNLLIQVTGTNSGTVYWRTRYERII